jgi:hypothetical protein
MVAAEDYLSSLSGCLPQRDGKPKIKQNLSAVSFGTGGIFCASNPTLKRLGCHISLRETDWLHVSVCVEIQCAVTIEYDT